MEAGVLLGRNDSGALARSFSAASIDDYHNLTEDNFYFDIKTTTGRTSTKTNAGTQITKTYDSETGTITFKSTLTGETGASLATVQGDIVCVY